VSPEGFRGRCADSFFCENIDVAKLGPINSSDHVADWKMPMQWLLIIICILTAVLLLIRPVSAIVITVADPIA